MEGRRAAFPARGCVTRAAEPREEEALAEILEDAWSGEKCAKKKKFAAFGHQEAGDHKECLQL